jgi:cell wall-associated NlpC family hydrolase
VLPRRIALLLMSVLVAVATVVPASVAVALTLPDDEPLDIRGGWVLRVGSAGHKVKALQQALGYPDSAWEVYDDRTRRIVRERQADLGLEVTGRVNRATWRALEVNGPWRMDAFNQTPRTTPQSTRRERVEVMVETARRYLGSEYVWGGSGTPRRGVDCSGLVLQAMYSAGLHPTGVSLRKHQTTDYSTTDALLADPGLRHIRLDQVRRGDLVFFTSNRTGKVNHVALALGPSRVIEAVEPEVRIGPLADRSSQRLHAVAIRPFPLSNS